MARTLVLDTIKHPSNSGTANIVLASDETTTLPKVDINSGTIDGTTLGAATPSTVAATSLSTTGNSTVGGTLSVTGNSTLSGSANNVGTITVGTWQGTTVAVAQGGTGTTTSTGTGSVVLSASPAFTGTPTHAGKNMCIWYVDNSQTSQTTQTFTIGAGDHIFWVTFSSGNATADIFCYGYRLDPGTWVVGGVKTGHGTPVNFSGSTTVSDANNTYTMSVSGGTNQVTFSRSSGSTAWNYHLKRLTNSR